MSAKQRQPKLKCKAPVKRRNSAVDPFDADIKQLIRQRQQDREELIGMSKMGANELFFQSCALRVNQLSPAMQALVQMQVSQIMFKAETSPSVPASAHVFPPCPKPIPIPDLTDANSSTAPTQSPACSGTAGV
ncbi:hypothetical protein HOLleu_14634 [Holothuria leucospilota]|uniref:Uncharacterized protein n=1 Tax=Holothuria leucospilota TaxID=206669 RepID=A0A9Q1C6S3_HOLLE|nr:hypothetical protein HOLleu_14634 [Holothuria leucospilota]